MGAEKKLESTVKGLKFPSDRGGGFNTGASWLNAKRLDDGAEGLWRVGDKLYDLEGWLDRHPGGSEWLRLTKGTDITEAFEVHHLNRAAERQLPKFYIRDAVTPRTSPFTFKPDGFYRRFKERVREALKDVDIHKSSKTTNRFVDSFVVALLTSCYMASATQSWILISAAAIFLTWTMVASHNFIHQKDSFRMYYMDLGLTSSKEWRISHAMSHHLFPNTIWDLEITVYEPLFHYLPDKDKGIITRYVSWIYSPLIYFTAFFVTGMRRIYTVFWQFGRPEFRDLIPFLIPTLMCFAAPPATAILTWLKITALSSFYFTMLSVTAAHHHPDIYHDGDVRREDTDWGLAQLDAVRDRVEVQPSIFLVLINFGSHTLHHLLPTIDHAYLELCEPAYVQTCKEFGVSTELWSTWKLIKGQFAQLEHVEPKKTPNIR